MRVAELLLPAPKSAGSFDRCVSLRDTLALVPRLRQGYRITRIADVTHLDRIGIPVVSAIVPDTNDIISVYNGKGLTREGALVGAVMEAVERAQGAELPDEVVVVDVRDPNVISPEELGAHQLWRGHSLEVVSAHDLVADEAVYVPVAAVCCPWRGAPVLRFSSSNGLAAGNTLAEAVLHALYELIERHLWSVAHAEGHLRPQAIISHFAGGTLAFPTFIDDPVASQIRLPTGISQLDELIARIRNAGLKLHLRCVEIEPFPILFSAAISDEEADLAHFGLGCSWSPEHAALRAVTEAAQSRAADFQAAREDLLQANDPRPAHGDHNRRSIGLPSGRWYYDAPAPRRTLASLPDRSTPDVAADLERIVSAFRERGLGRIAVVDRSPPDVPVHVVRVVAPALETAVIDDRIGPTIKEILDVIPSRRSPSPKGIRPLRKRAS